MNRVINGRGTRSGLTGEQPHVMDHFSNASLFLVGGKNDCGNTDSDSNETDRGGET